MIRLALACAKLLTVLALLLLLLAVQSCRNKAQDAHGRKLNICEVSETTAVTFPSGAVLVEGRFRETPGEWWVLAKVEISVEDERSFVRSLPSGSDVCTSDKLSSSVRSVISGYGPSHELSWWNIKEMREFIAIEHVDPATGVATYIFVNRDHPSSRTVYLLSTGSSSSSSFQRGEHDH